MRQIHLNEKSIPTKWYNIAADINFELSPPLGPDRKPLTPDSLAAIFPQALIEQEMSRERYIQIPEEVLEKYLSWRPTPLIRANILEKVLETDCEIYYKYEGVSGPGSHKPNTAVPQAYYNKIAGIKRLATETGAGQWGSSVAQACAMFGLEAVVYMVRCSFDQKPSRKTYMNLFGATVIPSPSPHTVFGRKILESDPECSGSLGIAISEAVEDAASRKDTNYCLGSVLNHVLLHQTIIGLETKEQLKSIGKTADVLVGCCGGGSNLGGLALPFIGKKLREGIGPEVIAVEPAACPTLTRGKFCYDFGDTAQMTPLIKMFTLGHNFMPAPIHAGGLRYHGAAPLISALVEKGFINAVAVHQKEVFESAMLFAKTEGIVPAPESAHAVKAAIDQARSGEKKVIVFSLSGHGYFDLYSYERYLSGAIDDYALPQEEINKSIGEIE